MPHSVERNAREWSVGDSEDLARLEIRHPSEVKDLSPGGDKVFIYWGQVRLGEHVDQVVRCDRLSAIAANHVDCKQLWFIGQGDAYGAIVAKVGGSTQSNEVYGIACTPAGVW